MTEWIDLQVDCLPDGSRVNAVSLDLQVHFEWFPGQTASTLHPPLPEEPATVEITEVRVKKRGPKYGPEKIPPEWEPGPRCFDEMLEAIILGEMKSR